MADLRVVLDEINEENRGQSWRTGFDMLEAAFLIFHDWGEYHMSNYFHEIGYWPKKDIFYETLTDQGRALYDMLDQEMGAMHYETITAEDFWAVQGTLLRDKAVLYGRGQDSVKSAIQNIRTGWVLLIFDEWSVEVVPDTQLLICKR